MRKDLFLDGKGFFVWKETEFILYFRKEFFIISSMKREHGRRSERSIRAFEGMNDMEGRIMTYTHSRGIKKKLIRLTAAGMLALLVTGCDKDAEQKTSCTLEKDGTVLRFTMEEKEERLSQVQAEVVLPSSLAGRMDMTTLSEEQLEKLSSSFLASLHVEKGEGVSVSSKMENKDLLLQAKIDMTCKQAGKMLEAMGIEEVEEASIKDLTDLLEKQSASCEKQ